MIGTVDCNIQAKYPSMPLDPMQAYVGSPSSIRVRNVPKRIGDWCIRNVQFVAVYPDASIKTAECKLVGGVWVGTIEGTQTSGRSEKGYSIFASGTDENGNEVSGYCLGKGDVEILKADGTIDPDAPSFYVKLLEEPSEDPKPGQMWFNGEELNIVDANGDVKTFEQPDLSEYRTKLDLSVYAADQTVIIAPDGSVFLPTTPTCSIDGNLAQREWVNGDTRIGWWGFVGEEEWIEFAIFDAPNFTNPVDIAAPYADPDITGIIVFHSEDVYQREARTLPTEDTLAKVSQLPDVSNYATKTELNVGLGTKQNNISANGILSGDGQGNITSADMSMYVKQYDSPIFNGLTAFGSNSIEGYATTAQLEDGLSGKADKYPFTTILDDSGAINLRDAEVQKYTAAAQQALSVYPPSGTSTTARDLVFVLDCAANNVSVNVQWANNIHPRTDASTDLSVLSNAVNVYYLSEYASGQFVIAGWQETAGGNI